MKKREDGYEIGLNFHSRNHIFDIRSFEIWFCCFMNEKLVIKTRNYAEVLIEKLAWNITEICVNFLANISSNLSLLLCARHGLEEGNVEWSRPWNINLFSTTFPLLYLLKTTENQRLSDVFRGNRSGVLVEILNALT